ncbi:MAG: protein kinase, partial [Pseudomonadota bacterium]
LLELFHLMVEREPIKTFLVFSKSSKNRKEIEEDMMRLAWFLFRSGYTVNRIATGYYKEKAAEFLNDRIMDYLVQNAGASGSTLGLSNHLAIITWIDFRSFFELQSDFCSLEEPDEVNEQIKILKKKKRRGAELLRKLLQLNKVYESKSQSLLASRYLCFRYESSFGSYHGSRRRREALQARAVEVYKPELDGDAVEKQTENELNVSGRSFSSKTREQMAGIVKLIINSLENPRQVRGEKVKVLGDISAGAMGKVSIGIYQDRIVALKTVRTDISHPGADPVGLLEYERAINERVQGGEKQHPYIADYYGTVEQGGERVLINGYFPNDNLTQLVERNWTEKYKPPFSVQSRISFATLEVVAFQLLECLRHFREKGIIHRDLKTDNILYTVDENENVNRIIVIDFGVAVACGSDSVEDFFKGKVVGTFSYMAPEQSRGRTLFQSDLYSVGAILTVLMTGKLPLVFPRTRTRAELAKQILRIEKEPRPKLTEMNPRLLKHSALEHFAAIVEQFLDLDPMRRPTIEEAQSGIKGVLDDLGSAKNGLYVFYHHGAA